MIANVGKNMIVCVHVSQDVMKYLEISGEKSIENDPWQRSKLVQTG